MTHGDTDLQASTGPRRERARTVALVSRQFGVAFAIAGFSAAMATLGVAVVTGTATGFRWVGRAMAAPLVGEPGIAWGFHVAAVTGFVGTWLLGLALVVEGYFGVE